VSEQDFVFALDLSGDPDSDQMVADLARTVLGHVGYANAAITEVSATLRSVLAERLAGGKSRCEVRFRAAAGELEIIVAGADRAEWRTTWPLPVS
jgi:hypothetical protein